MTDRLPVRYTSDPPDQVVDEDALLHPQRSDAATTTTTTSSAEGGDEEEEVEDPHARLVLAIQLDGDMYDAFFQTARRVLNMYDNAAARDQLHRLGLRRSDSLAIRRATATAALRRMLPNARVDFVDAGIPEHPAAARRMLCNAATREWLHNTDTGALVLPQRLFAHPGKRTDSVFFLKLADQLMRHRWQQVLLFRPEVAYLFGADKLEQRADETVIALPNLTDEYFRSLVAAADSRQQRRTIYDFHRAVDQMPLAPIPQL